MRTRTVTNPAAWLWVILLSSMGCGSAGPGELSPSPGESKEAAAAPLTPRPDPQSDPRVPRVEASGPGLVPSAPSAEVAERIPASWRAQHVPVINGQRMVDAKYRIPTSFGDVQVNISLAAGGVEANLERWIQQMETDPSDPPERTQRAVGDVTAYVIDCLGTFHGQLLESIPPRNCRMIGLVIPRDGPRDLTIKVVGSASAVNRFESELDSFLASLSLSAPLP